MIVALLIVAGYILGATSTIAFFLWRDRARERYRMNARNMKYMVDGLFTRDVQ